MTDLPTHRNDLKIEIDSGERKLGNLNDIKQGYMPITNNYTKREYPGKILDVFAPEKTIKLKCKNISQITTRGDGKLEKKTSFDKQDIDFGSALHLKIHQHGQDVAGSEFNEEVFPTEGDIIDTIISNLPDTLQYDQFDRCEITITLEGNGDQPIGWSGVKNIHAMREMFPQIEIIREARNPGGVQGEENGIEGVWYPEMERTASGFVIAMNKDGDIKNPKAKFEPLANIAKIPENYFDDALSTDELTIIIQKDVSGTEKPSVLTIFPGKNAPAFPARIDTEFYKADTLGSNSKENEYWKHSVFLKKDFEIKE